MSKIKLLSIAVVGLLVLNLGTLAFLFFTRPYPMDEPERNFHRDGPKRIIIERLHFDNGQVAQYEMLIAAHRKRIGELDDQIRQAKNYLYSSLAEVSIWQRDSLMVRLGELQQQVESTHYEHLVEIKKLCRPEQLPYFKLLSRDFAKLFRPGKIIPPPPKD
ncbi:hypothetical protein [Chitinophaga sp. LS1]|uniref:hypothetical protein n=1 Tax=Chitinophaga sp. LS1 TaxID=3051176 RepID=UPI002AAAE6AD|nr:hypothetical protein [Chitinophaga sp. LS1]WPV69975.1 hypothetical protein QQL36_14825 [Chitinophaga sp. LS1]